jgi:4-hydroxybenzoate polyprenyltransferase/phosphoserine phosphatase
MQNTHPLVVDLDGTLIRTDMLQESTLVVLRDNPSSLLRLPLWLAHGKAYLKRKLAERSELDPQHLPYNLELLSWLTKQREAGRKLILCTASDQIIANAIAGHLGIFDEVMASDGVTNLSGKNKASALEQRFGNKGFDYAGNSIDDVPVWTSAQRSIVVNASSAVSDQAAKIGHIENTFPAQAIDFGVFRRVLRVHQWMKNLLLFVPFFASHQITQSSSWLALIVAFVSFGLCASSVYIVNDLLDLSSDRQHYKKRFRPFASGAVPIWMGVLLVPLLWLGSVVLALQVNNEFLLCLGCYFIITCAYSFKLKRLVILDCITLAMLYTLRVVAGSAAAQLPFSFWLLAFSVFLFLSLAFVKRYAELLEHSVKESKTVHGRGYTTSDTQLIQLFGTNAGYAAVIVLALYLNSDAIVRLYRNPEIVWATVPVMLFWINWVWLQAHRGQMHDDPVVFALKDKNSLIAGFVFAVIVALGAVGMPW